MSYKLSGEVENGLVTIQQAYQEPTTYTMYTYNADRAIRSMQIERFGGVVLSGVLYAAGIAAQAVGGLYALAGIEAAGTGQVITPPAADVAIQGSLLFAAGSAMSLWLAPTLVKDVKATSARIAFTKNLLAQPLKQPVA